MAASSVDHQAMEAPAMPSQKACRQRGTAPRIDPSLVQDSTSTMDQIRAEIRKMKRRKRAELDMMNRFEFCLPEEGITCARTRAVFRRTQGMTSHMKVVRVQNAWGPQTHREEVAAPAPPVDSSPTKEPDGPRPLSPVPISLSPEPQGSDGQATKVTERRLQKMEKLLGLTPSSGQQQPEDVSLRLERLEAKLALMRKQVSKQSKH